MLNYELFLTTIPAKSEEDKLIGSSWKKVFPILDKDITDENIYDVLQIINMNKLYERGSSFIVEDSWNSYEKLSETFKENIPKFNDELISIYKKKYSDFNAECIVKPQSDNEWLRKGLSERFSEELDIKCIVAYKNKNIKLGGARKEDPELEGFEFTYNEDMSSFKRILIIDESKSKGTTIDFLKESLPNAEEIVEVFYCKTVAEY